MENNKYLTVTALNKYISYKFETDTNLGLVYIKGELSNIRFSKGYLYFVLKDPTSEITGIMFNANKLTFTPTDGMKVYITGKVAVYQKKGYYNLTAFEMTEYGLGDLYQKFLALKEKLAKEGLFDEKHKKKIPEFPEHIGVITSETADALQDIKSTIELRFPIARLYLYPALVQGADASKSVIAAIKKANEEKIVDVLIIARGGGSVEDLFCFNDETLAREIFNSEIPIVSGVGHETDFTICDFVSDERAPTPTGAAVRVTKNKTEIINKIDHNISSMFQVVKNILERCYNNYLNLSNNHYFKNYESILDEKIKNIDNLTKRLSLSSPDAVIEKNQNNLNNLIHRINLLNLTKKIDTYNDEINLNLDVMKKSFVNTIVTQETAINQIIDKLILLNPLNIMKKGYTLTYQNQKLIYSIDEIDYDKDMDVVFRDGLVKAKIVEIKKGK